MTFAQKINDMNIFEMIWVDFIVNIKDPDYKSMWKFYTMSVMTTLFSLNIMTFVMFLTLVGVKFPEYEIHIDIFQGKMLDGFLESFIVYGTPSLLINYFTIFYKNRYKKLIKQHKGHNGKYMFLYFIITIVLFWIPVVFS